MGEEVVAENLHVGDLVVLSTTSGAHVVRLTSVEHRANGIKLKGRRRDGALYSFGMKYGQLAAQPDGPVEDQQPRSRNSG